MEWDEFFLATLDDIDRVLARPTPYQVIRMTGVLRQLLLDGETLVDKVNRNHRVKIRFWFHKPPAPVARPEKGKTLVFSMFLDAIDPSVVYLPPHLFGPLTIGGREEFLKTIVGFSNGHEFSIADMIKHAAHVLGGIHAGKSESDLDVELTNLNLDGSNFSAWQLSSVLNVVRNGLRPLERIVRETRSLNKTERQTPPDQC